MNSKTSAKAKPEYARGTLRWLQEQVVTLVERSLEAASQNDWDPKYVDAANKSARTLATVHNAIFSQYELDEARQFYDQTLDERKRIERLVAQAEKLGAPIH